jgi:hypothetical protein
MTEDQRDTIEELIGDLTLGTALVAEALYQLGALGWDIAIDTVVGIWGPTDDTDGMEKEKSQYLPDDFREL